jgi:hypothetical protein
MATACWDFIVATTTGLETAPLLDLLSLQPSNIEKLFTSYPQTPVDALGVIGEPLAPVGRLFRQRI